MTKKILILGANGFIGHHLSRRILDTTTWEVHAMDIAQDRLSEQLSHPRFHFFKGDIRLEQAWIDAHIQLCDIILPLVAIATPATYISDPLSVFELDFEANLPIVRATVKHGKRLVFPSTSEVYGMSTDEEFNPETTQLVYGPVTKSRWIYACSKQLMDRVICAYGQQHGLRFTLFRPFNWIGQGQDSLAAAHEGSSRVVTKFLYAILHGQPITLVDGGAQHRSFTCITDGVEALMRILADTSGLADGKIYNIGNPHNDVSVAELANRMVAIAAEYPALRESAAKVHFQALPGTDVYGSGYEDPRRRIPNIAAAKTDLSWSPEVGLDAALRSIFTAYDACA
ncbi:bifunctional UDP-4-keto-pentose/UDP-xylose synthase [Duganella sp. FT92W]|uniref:Bifunctional UDP-4-keto-pentose/UDP-xylose synthase n=1 Tax=Pseudoduganella rivuli TaxID=2666085 RepID=A0A7X2IJD7_9BURK|nr:bifunctional UDP-4-keto-pentose/UDP-xylose synthase [Pseudoduganella rivuli]MRV71121.1 bifunctional UDP-4-keto-pentose/UDP-xylose synthase [Pseudoduganella rivuli]